MLERKKLQFDLTETKKSIYWYACKKILSKEDNRRIF